MQEELEEFIVQGDEVQSSAFANFLEEECSVELVTKIAKDVVVLRMAADVRDVVAKQFRNLIIEPNAPLKRL